MAQEFQSAFKKDDIAGYPLYKYDGEIVLVRSPEESETALRRIGTETVLGFDTESKPNFRKGMSNNPSLIQLATLNAVFIFQLKILQLDKALTTIFSDHRIIKTGVGIAEDMRLLRKLHDFEPAGLVDLGDVARKNTIKTSSLRGLAAIFMEVRISKAARCSNWSKTELTGKQIDYAATDAWISRQVYMRMREHRLI